MTREEEPKEKSYIVRSWFVVEDIFKDLESAKKGVEELKKYDRRKDIEIIEVEKTFKKVNLWHPIYNDYAGT